MCTYNGARFLGDQLTSLAAQVRLPYELVVCDDASTDDSAEIVEKFAGHAAFPVRFQRNSTTLGSTKNFEQAIAMCDGDIIALCDQDDIWDPQKLSLMDKLFSEHAEVNLVFTDAEIVDEQARPVDYGLWEALGVDTQIRLRLTSGNVFDQLIVRPCITGATMAFRAKFKDLVLPIPTDSSLIHDGWITLMLSLVGRFGSIDLRLIKYRQHDSQQLGVPEKRAAESTDQKSKFLLAAKRLIPLEAEIRKLEAVRTRVDERKGKYEFEDLSSLDNRLDHLRTREAISQRQVFRVPAALGELFAGRYHRFSNGFYSLVKDLVR
jgi:glycosyltransferase involved in cell wall biosynthesis